ncbi:UvrD-helicase domain-containing protein [bacterium]|nr:UvrD-helicase domain-containing protein [bacterium]
MPDRKPDKTCSRWLEGLNPDQARAVTSPSARLLIQAGAGSGKTTVIVRRILHLVDCLGVPPSSILAITFTRNAAREMARRLAGSPAPENALRREPLGSVQVRTFHSLCYVLLKRHWRLVSERPLVLVTDSAPSGEAQDGGEAPTTKSGLLLETVRRCFDLPRYRVAFKRYLWSWLLSADESDPHGGLSDPRQAAIATTGGVTVRSWAERDIANWLTRHGIKFVYSEIAPWSAPAFSPDFHLPELDCYLEIWEHAQADAPARQERLAQYRIREKRLIQVEREELFDFAALEARLAESLPECFPDGSPSGGPSDLDDLLSEEAGYPEAVGSFMAQAEEVLDRMKNHSIPVETVAERARNEKDRRTRVFFSLFLPLYERYQALLTERGALDFNDLILKTVALLRTNPALRERLRRRWPHVLVDEYQDVNTPQVDLLRELVGPGSSLTAVGDDWQSIYGFRGSDVTHIRSFGQDFPGAATVTLRLNYRSGKSIVDFAAWSIRRSRRYTDKPLHALNRDVQPVVLHRGVRLSEDGVAWVVETAQELIECCGYAPEDILVLYRRSSSFRVLGAALRQRGLKLRHLTIHAAKGLEAPVVFLWGVVGGRGGFPSVWDDGRIVRLLLPRDYQSRLDEEKRVFYVALTRARERLFIVTERRNLSEFLDKTPESFFLDSAVFQAETPKKPGEYFCAACGSRLEGSWMFCPYCYHGLQSGPQGGRG